MLKFILRLSCHLMLSSGQLLDESRRDDFINDGTGWKWKCQRGLAAWHWSLCQPRLSLPLPAGSWADVTQSVASPGRGWMRWSPVCHLTLTLQTITWHPVTCRIVTRSNCGLSVAALGRALWLVANKTKSINSNAYLPVWLLALGVATKCLKTQEPTKSVIRM